MSDSSNKENHKNINDASKAVLALSTSFSIILLSTGCFILMLSKSGCM